MREIFFKDGIMTSTEANHLANLAGELASKMREDLNQLTFVNVKIESLDGTSTKPVQHGFEKLDGLEDSLEFIGKLHSFIAWTREAISEKSKLTNKAQNIDFEDWCKENNIVLKRPSTGSYLKLDYTDDIMAEMSIKDLNEYYYLEAASSAIGKIIHPGNSFSNAKKELAMRLKKTTEVSTVGNTILITRFEPSISYDEVEKTFMKLQDKHRTLSARLNQIKHTIDQKVSDRKLNDTLRYKEDLRKHVDAVDEYAAKYNKDVIEKLEEIKKLKIALPINLEGVYNELKALGK